MNISLKRVLTIFLCIVLLITTSLYTAAADQSQLNKDIEELKKQASSIQSEINKLKSQKAEQGVVLSAIRKKIANTQAQIDRCNQEIASINAKIAENNAAIEAKEQEIESDKTAFKKRIRAIYMSNSDSTVQILMGADDFADFLQLSQLTASVSSHDKRLMEDLKSEIEILNQKNAENEVLINDQVAIRATINEQQKVLEADENDAAAIYNNIAGQQADQQENLDDVNADIRRKQKELEDAIKNASYTTFINPNTGLQWPVSGFLTVSSHFGPRWGTNHNGMDIAGGGIAGQPILAVADGYVTLVDNRCTHNYKKSGNCCGNGYGNYCTVNHGSLTINGQTSNYVAYYAHASKIIVSNGQYVKQGQVLGYVGTTGWSTGYHLHFGMLKDGKWINPYPLFF